MRDGREKGGEAKAWKGVKENEKNVKRLITSVYAKLT